jgi:hypothetical protein
MMDRVRKPSNSLQINFVLILDFDIFWSGGIFRSELRRLSFGLEIIQITSLFNTSDDMINKIIILKLFRKVRSQSEASDLFFLSHVSRQ